ncbi:hypothetical protein [Botrimarina hoheduenensis]|uniref:Uncharacterized protein n=1 Tax=Botrimarina hoheduenensis TaxID=2528000 RepID=A0A5C5WC39_9BACT|nr:hypothetical protein [Botrimarina hoheduenensis]TWT47222.1 hypothetical protein Pla111_08340 [Botrimarina hoheduenensis]
MTPLRLPAGRIPKTKDFSRTIADEVVVSQRVKDAFEECGVSGANFATVVSTSRSKGFVEGRYQFEATEAAAEVAPPTVSGNKPSDLDTEGEYRCARCGLLGLNLLSELSVTRASVLDLDVQATRAYVGLRSGLLRPRQVVLVSPKVYRLAKEMKLKGVAFEIAYLV